MSEQAERNGRIHDCLSLLGELAEDMAHSIGTIPCKEFDAMTDEEIWRRLRQAAEKWFSDYSFSSSVESEKIVEFLPILAVMLTGIAP